MLMVRPTTRPVCTHVYTAVLNLVLKSNSFKFTPCSGPLSNDACIAKSFEVLALIFSTDCSPIDWLQSALKITRFQNGNQASRRWGEKLNQYGAQVEAAAENQTLCRKNYFAQPAIRPDCNFFGDWISAPFPPHTVPWTIDSKPLLN